MKLYFVKTLLFFFIFCISLLSIIHPPVQGQTNKTVEDLYPGLASGALKAAIPAKLPKGTLLTAGSLKISESQIAKAINRAEPEVRKQLAQNAFYLLEGMATKQILLQEAYKAGHKKGEEDKIISNFLSEKIKIPAISEEELKNFHSQNKEMLRDASFEDVRESLKVFLGQQKKQEAFKQYFLTLGQRTTILVSEEWVKTQGVLTLDNPVDRARRSGKPTMVEFGATGCVPCDMMTPILADLRKKYKDKLNVLFVHVGQEQIMGARFGIQNIPIQVFFDHKGREVFRHAGFFPQTELEKKMIQMNFIN